MTRPATISWIGYGWETTFASASASIDKAYGHGVRVTNLTRRNNIEQLFSTGYRNAQKLAVKQFEGAITTEHVLANPWFFQGVLGSVATTGSGPYYHTFSEADTIPSLTISNNLNTAAVRKANLLGAKISNCTITAAVGELARVRLDQPYVNEAFTTTTSGKLADTFELFSFAQGSIELPDGTSLAMVQNFEASIANTPETVLGLGSRFGQEMPVKNRSHTGSITMALQASADLLEILYGGSTGPADTVDEQADMQLTFTNGLTGTSERTIEATWTGIQLDEESMPQDPTQVILEDASWMARSLSVIATNNTTTAL